DEDGLLRRVGVRGVLERGPGVLGRLVGARLDPVPEGVTRSLVGDHREGVAGVPAATPAAGVLGLGLPSPAAGRDEKCERGDQGDGAACPASRQVHEECSLRRGGLPPEGGEAAVKIFSGRLTARWVIVARWATSPQRWLDGVSVLVAMRCAGENLATSARETPYSSGGVKRPPRRLEDSDGPSLPIPSIS